MKRTTTIIVGAGQSGLAFSRHLAARGIDHVVLERGEVANSWAKERWDSLRLLTPNWQSRLPGYSYDGDDPHGYMTATEVVAYLRGYANASGAPVRSGTTVTSVAADDCGYVVETDRGAWHGRTVVLAAGACNVASVPRCADGLPAGIASVTPLTYRNADTLENGGVLVVGASASGVQLAKEIQRSGRQVTLSVGEHVRVPRLYRGRDIKWWMDAAGILDVRHDAVDDIGRARGVASLQLAGTPERRTLDLNALRAEGVSIAGRLAGLKDGRALFSGGLANLCALADLKMNRLLDQIDVWAAASGVDAEVEAPHRFAPTRVDARPPLGLDLASAGIRTVVWATGYRPDWSWLHVPVLDRKGRIGHDGGVVDAPGLYVMGLPYLRRRKSTLIDGAGDDAAELAEHLCTRLLKAAA